MCRAMIVVEYFVFMHRRHLRWAQIFVVRCTSWGNKIRFEVSVTGIDSIVFVHFRSINVHNLHGLIELSMSVDRFIFHCTCIEAMVILEVVIPNDSRFVSNTICSLVLHWLVGYGWGCIDWYSYWFSCDGWIRISDYFPINIHSGNVIVAPIFVLCTCALHNIWWKRYRRAG